jgi:hypothetical protein
VNVYQTAIRCTVNEDLRTEWQGYLEETENHVRIVNDIFSQLDLDPAVETTPRVGPESCGSSHSGCRRSFPRPRSRRR